MANSRTYGVWGNMLYRCNNPKAANYYLYGGRGIRVCERWHSFENFYADMGDKPPGLSIERINNNGNYEPGNCRWATPNEQAVNKRSTHFLILDGKPMTLRQIADEAGVKYCTVRERFRKGWPKERLFLPKQEPAFL